MTPLIKLDDVNSDENLFNLGQRIMDVFGKADGFRLDKDTQSENMRVLIEAQKQTLGFLTTVPPRFFVFYWCRLLQEQRQGEVSLGLSDATKFIQSNVLPDSEDI
jgi:hypothetical protein